MRAIVLISILAFGCVVGHPETPFETLYTEFWEWRKTNNPEFASNVGDNSYTDQLEDYSLDAFEGRKNAVQGFIDRLRDDVQRDSLNANDRVSYDVMMDMLQTWMDGYKWRYYGPMNGISFLDGIQTNYGSRAGQVKFRNEGDFRKFITRINGYADRVTQTISRMNKAIEMNTTHHAVSMTGVPGQLDLILQYKSSKPVTDFPMYEPFKTMLDGLSDRINETTRSELRAQAEAAIMKFVDQIQVLKDYIEGTYMANTRAEYGVSSLPNGAEYYQACLKWHLSVDMTAEEIHQKGLDEVARITGEMEKIMMKQGHEGSVKEYFDMLKNDSQYFTDNKTEVLAMYHDVLDNRIRPKMHKFFNTIPDFPMEIQEMPYDGPIGIYKNGAPDGSRPGVFLANVHHPETIPSFGMVTLMLHETDPGHHVQDAFALTSQSIPEFRKATDFSKYFAVPLHFPFYTAYAEGWALYTEDFGEELSIFKNDVERMGKYSSEIFRATRLVVDTGIHAMGWSKERAVEYILNYTDKARSSAEREINRYITWPGQATSYKIGHLKFRELRQKMINSLCDHFNLKDFHDVVLVNGAMPLSVMEDVVDDHIQSVKDSLGKDPCDVSSAPKISSAFYSLILLLSAVFVF